MFAELYLPPATLVDRDEVEDALVDAIAGAGEVSGAGAGTYGSNLDLDLEDDVDLRAILETARSVVSALGISGRQDQVRR